MENNVINFKTKRGIVTQQDIEQRLDNIGKSPKIKETYVENGITIKVYESPMDL